MTRFRNASKDTFRSLRHRNFRIFFITQGISFTGTWLQLAAQTLLIYKLTDSGVELGVLAALQFLPTLLLGAWAGVVIDRHDKRKLMTITSSVMLFAAALLGALVLVDRVNVGTVYVLAALLGLANTFDNPARRVLVNDLVPQEDLVNAVGLNSTLVTAARIIGPAVAGVLVLTVGIGWCFVLNGVSFVPVLLGLRAMDWAAMPQRPPVPKEKGQLAAGLRYAWSVDELRVPLLVMALIGTLAFNYTTVLPVFSDRVLHGNDATFSILTTVMGVGSLVGSLRMARRDVLDTRFVAMSALVLAGSTAGLAFAPNLAVACIAIVVVGYAGIGVLSGGNAVLQLAASPEMRGRVLALFTVVFLGSTPIGGPIVGYATEHAGAPVGFMIGGVAALLSGGHALLFLRRRRIAVDDQVLLAEERGVAAASAA